MAITEMMEYALRDAGVISDPAFRQRLNDSLTAFQITTEKLVYCTQCIDLPQWLHI
jgi:hypothetical protein